jgi:hypothetical protein
VVNGVVDHINISRHHYFDSDNRSIFKTNGVPSGKELGEIVRDGDYEADFCFNCVIAPSVTARFCEDFIDWSRDFGNIAAVNFRIYHNSMEDCSAQEAFEKKYGATDVSTCPVCKVVRMNVRGMQVNWKYSVLEPTQHWDGIYELVMQPDGRLTADWAGKLEVDPAKIEGGSVAKTNRELAEELIELAKRLLEEDKPTKSKKIKKHIQPTVYSGGSCHSPSGGGCR